jgi:hypothetical protein
MEGALNRAFEALITHFFFWFGFCFSSRLNRSNEQDHETRSGHKAETYGQFCGVTRLIKEETADSYFQGLHSPNILSQNTTYVNRRTLSGAPVALLFILFRPKLFPVFPECRRVSGSPKPLCVQLEHAKSTSLSFKRSEDPLKRFQIELFHEQLPLPVPCYDLLPVTKLTVSPLM